MNFPIKIHETAFFTATFRASNQALSKDPYSVYWKNNKTDQYIGDYLNKVSQEEAFVHCLRNRFFYETIKRLIDKKEIEVLINFGCGFSMYPFLFKEELVNIEIDQEVLIEYKKDHIQKWIKEGKLPYRKIHYLTKDFNLNKAELESEIKSITNGRASFVILEGVLFYLNETSADHLIELISRIQITGSYFGSVSFLDSIVDTNCFKRLINFCENQVELNSKFEFLTKKTSYYETLPEYNLIEHEDYISLSKKYTSGTFIENGELILNENMYLLRKK